MTEPVGAFVALKLTHTPFSVSSVLGLLALLGVSVETAVILVSYINKLRLEGLGIRDGDARGIVAAASSDHDDGTCGVFGITAGRTIDGHWFRYSKAFCHCHCCGTNFQTVHRIFCKSCALRNGRSRRRRSADLIHRPIFATSLKRCASSNGLHSALNNPYSLKRITQNLFQRCDTAAS